MASVVIEDLQYTAGSFALRDISLRIADGEYFVLLGKPGSGKTLLLECLVGLRRIERGRILIGGEEVHRREPRERGIGYVPQDYALFSTRTVRENIEFGLRVRRVSPAQRRQRVEELAELLGIAHLLDRGVSGLSGGERQRVALARALAPRPRILVLDEPISALDAKTRIEILAELKRVQRATATTVLHVCHDLDEMHFVAERVAILSAGRVVQQGTPAEVARRPAHTEVAELLDLGVVLAGAVADSGAEVAVGGMRLPLTRPCPPGAAKVLVRAADIRLAAAPAGDGWLEAEVQSVLWRDVAATAVISCHGVILRARLPAAEARGIGLKPGATVGVYVPSRAVEVFGPDGAAIP